ncbi:ANTAR domain-containing response regulator [Curtobacterium sp. ME26]|uniref:ANTAR domain-containing response regulator n=1 Tax=Curtobacterium sp. ME26 TaxID=2744254 RepID=UPI003986E79C
MRSGTNASVSRSATGRGRPDVFSVLEPWPFLQRALDSRVLIEQAKGILSTQHGITLDEAYRILRHRARSRQSKISAVAEAVVAGDLQVGPQQHPPTA